MGRRAVLRVDRAQSTAGKRLRGYQSTPHAPSSTPHPSCCSCVGSLVLHDFRNRLSAKAEQSSLRNPVSRQQRCHPDQFHGVEMRRLTTIERFSDYRARSDSPAAIARVISAALVAKISRASFVVYFFARCIGDGDRQQYSAPVRKFERIAYVRGPRRSAISS